MGRQSRVNLFLIAAFIVVVDQATKAWVLANLATSAAQQEPLSWFDGLVSLIYTPNPGAAFGLLADQTALFVLVAIVVAAATVAYYRYLPRHSLWLRVSLGLQLGGALGNLIDRLHHGFVVDFLEVWTWPVFNVADSAIVIGVLMLAYYLLVRYDTTRPTTTPVGQSQQIEENDTPRSLLNH